MTQIEQRQQVRKMADQMERRLLLHDDDRGNEGWLGEDFFFLERRLREEVFELMTAIYCRTSTPEEIWAEAADVANFAMMLANNYEVQYQGD